MEDRGWDQVDFVYVTGDAYVDHSSFGTAIISRLLEAGAIKWELSLSRLAQEGEYCHIWRASPWLPCKCRTMMIPWLITIPLQKSTARRILILLAVKWVCGRTVLLLYTVI